MSYITSLVMGALRIGSTLISPSFCTLPVVTRQETTCFPFTRMVQSPQKPTEQVPRKARLPSCSSRMRASASKTVVSGGTSSTL